MRWITAVTALAFLAIPTIASAHAGNPDPNMVHVCIGNVSKVVRSVGVGGVCISGPPILAETADHWPKLAIAGPKGDKGDQGIQGIQGVPGIPGTNGTDGIDGTNGTRADGPCFDNTNRYVKCGNGTVADTVTGLIWLTDAACLGMADWAAANGAAAALETGQCGLTDNSSPGDWRLPTKDEWSATIARAVALGCTSSNAPPLTNDAGTACLSVGPSSFAEVRLEFYWSSSTDETVPSDAWVVNLENGFVGSIGFKGTALRAWPVRGGPR